MSFENRYGCYKPKNEIKSRLGTRAALVEDLMITVVNGEDSKRVSFVIDKSEKSSIRSLVGYLNGRLDFSFSVAITELDGDTVCTLTNRDKLKEDGDSIEFKIS